MKKLLILTAFLSIGSLATMAQNTVPAKPTKSTNTADVKQPATQPTAATAEVVDVVAPATTIDAKTTSNKKSDHCAPSDKKSCGSEKNSSKKGCCSKK